MNRPHIACHMMTSVDGRIDCAMTEHLPGVQEYYDTLDELGAPSRISGRVTAQLEMSLPGEFRAEKNEPFGSDGFSKAASDEGYEIVIDTNGTLLWEDDSSSRRPLLMVTSKNRFEKGKWVECAECDESRRSKAVCLTRRCNTMLQSEITGRRHGRRRIRNFAR